MLLQVLLSLDEERKLPTYLFIFSLSWGVNCHLESVAPVSPGRRNCKCVLHCIRGSLQHNLAYTGVETHPREKKKRVREICTISMCLLREHLGRNHTIAEVEHVDHPPKASREGNENLEVLLRFVPSILNPFHSHRPPAIKSYNTSDAVIISASYLQAEVSKFD